MGVAAAQIREQSERERERVENGFRVRLVTQGWHGRVGTSAPGGRGQGARLVGYWVGPEEIAVGLIWRFGRSNTGSSRGKVPGKIREPRIRSGNIPNRFRS